MKKKKEFSIFLLLVVLFAFSGWKEHRFLDPYNLSNMSRLVGVYGILSMGAGFVIITGGIDLTTGAVFSLQLILLSAFLVGFDAKWGGLHIHINPMPWQIGCLLSIACVTFLGLIHALLIAKLRLQAFIVTLCGWLIYRGLARAIVNDTTVGFLLSDSDNKTVSDYFPFLHKMASEQIEQVFFKEGFWDKHATLHHYLVPFLCLKMPFVIMLVIGVVLWVVLHRSVYGRHLFAAGRNEDAARFSGINTVRVIGFTYILNMMLVGVACILDGIAVEGGAPSSFGMVYELYAIAAAVLGGCSLRGGEGSVIGIIMGTALLVVLRNMVNLLGWAPQLDYVVTGGVILAAVIVDRTLEILNEVRARRAAAAASGPVEKPVVAG